MPLKLSKKILSVGYVEMEELLSEIDLLEDDVQASLHEMSSQP